MCNNGVMRSSEAAGSHRNAVGLTTTNPYASEIEQDERDCLKAALTGLLLSMVFTATWFGVAFAFRAS